jgi:hypothetical protein
VENFSKNTKKRGRPKKILDNGKTFDEWILKAGLSKDEKSERWKINTYYTAVAQAALADENGNHSVDGEFNFIIAANNLEIVCFKRTILIELGRLEDEKMIRGVARVICQNKLSTDDAITYIRQFRTKQKPAGDKEKLALSIGKAIDEYKFKHLDVDNEMIRASLNLVLSVFPENVSENAENSDKR